MPIFSDLVIIAHRGASGYLPEHTLAAYTLAIFQGADFIEPDLVMSSDGILHARHDNRLELSTNVSGLPQFVDRRRPGEVDGEKVSGWFSEDFSAAELRQLRARERISSLRPANSRFDDQFPIPAFSEIVALVQALEPVLGRRIGLYPEIKHPAHFGALGLPAEQALIRILHAAGYRDHADPVFLQSFEPRSLRMLRSLTELPLIQLLACSGVSADQRLADDVEDYARMATAAGLRRIAGYADGVGVDKRMILRPDTGGNLLAAQASTLTEDAHTAGLCVHAYTFRAENVFLPAQLQSSSKPDAIGDLAAELALYRQLGVDGFFVDQPDVAVKLWR